MVRGVSETDGQITVTVDDIKAEDIPTLPQAKISGLETEYVKKSEFKTVLDDNDTDFFKDDHVLFEVVKDTTTSETFLRLYNSDSGKGLSVNVDGFIAKGLVESVEVVASGIDLKRNVYPPENGPYIHVTWKTDKEVTDSFTPIKNLV